MKDSELCYVYLQHPVSGEWATVGRYTLDRARLEGWFRYAPGWLQDPTAVAIDPINLPLLDIPQDRNAPRYQGLHDVLRDAGPDGWGKRLIERENGLTPGMHEYDYLRLAGNLDRWGALKTGAGRKPDAAQANHPSLSRLDELVDELDALAAGLPARHQALRRRLVQTASVGGARPKTTVRDGETQWLVKPRTPGDPMDIPGAEHAAMTWAARTGLNVAATRLHASANHSALLVQRFDRQGTQRHMTLSGATLLEAEYPGNAAAHQGWSYPLLANALTRIGAPVADLHELYQRMIFNALCGNDDDHPRNHAAIYVPAQRRWRLSPAFDVVPNPVEMPRTLAMQIAPARWEISRANMLDSFARFGFATAAEAARVLDIFVQKALFTLQQDPALASLFPAGFRAEIMQRAIATAGVLSGG